MQTHRAAIATGAHRDRQTVRHQYRALRQQQHKAHPNAISLVRPSVSTCYIPFPCLAHHVPFCFLLRPADDDDAGGKLSAGAGGAGAVLVLVLVLVLR
jgi:hypothetical protein